MMGSLPFLASTKSGLKAFSRAPDATLPFRNGCGDAKGGVVVNSSGVRSPGGGSSSKTKLGAELKNRDGSALHAWPGMHCIYSSMQACMRRTRVSACARMSCLMPVPVLGALGIEAMSAAVPATKGTAAEVPLMRA